MNVLTRLPDPIQNNPDAGWLALVASIQRMWDLNEADIRVLGELYDPLKSRAVLLEEVGALVSAQIRPGDSERTRRQKIVGAIKGHRNRGLWQADLKLRIDAITGYNSVLYSVIDSDDSIEMANQADDPDYYWSTESPNDGVDIQLGTWEIGSISDLTIVGNVAINLHDGVTTPVISADMIQQIIDDIIFDFIPAYYILYLGYQNSSGGFIQYPGGVI